MRTHRREMGRGGERTGLDVLPIGEAARVCDDALARKQPVFAWASPKCFPRAHTERPDAVRVAERDNSEAGEHSDARVRALDLLHEAADGVEDILLVDAELARLLEVIGEDVEEELRVGGGVDVSVRDMVHVVEQGGSID